MQLSPILSRSSSIYPNAAEDIDDRISASSCNEPTIMECIDSDQAHNDLFIDFDRLAPVFVCMSKRQGAI